MKNQVKFDGEIIDSEWMTETAPTEYAHAGDKHSDYLGCTYKEYVLNTAIRPCALAWFASDDGEAAMLIDSYCTGNEDFDADMLGFFADLQAKFYCKALSDGASGEKAVKMASDALNMVFNSYIDHLHDWNEDIEG